MARLDADISPAIAQLERLEGALWRQGKRRIVEAGAKAEIDVERRQVEAAHHVKTGAMLRGVDMGEYREDLDGAAIDVYPKGEDGRGVSNALKAFVIDRGLGHNPTRRGTTNKTGDHFITGGAMRVQGEQRVLMAMDAEANKILSEVR